MTPQEKAQKKLTSILRQGRSNSAILSVFCGMAAVQSALTGNPLITFLSGLSCYVCIRDAIGFHEFMKISANAEKEEKDEVQKS